jgi:predicted kinase
MADGFETSSDTVAVDFDDTVRDGKTEQPEDGVKDALERIRASGLKVVISSARTSAVLYSPEEIQEHVKTMTAFMEEHGLPYDSIDDGSKGKIPRFAYIGNEAVSYRRRRSWSEIAARIVPHKGLKLIAMVGFPGSGKSTFSRRLMTDDGAWARVNLDEISNMVGGPYNELRRVYHRVELEGIRAAFENGKHVMVDRTNLSREKRSRWSAVGKEYQAWRMIAFVSVEVDVYRERNETRKGGSTYVEPDAYERHWKSFEFPDLRREDYDELVIVDADFNMELHQVRRSNGEIATLTAPGQKQA